LALGQDIVSEESDMCGLLFLCITTIGLVGWLVYGVLNATFNNISVIS
jgi:uncharacterized protein with PQ loop repeat